MRQIKYIFLLCLLIACTPVKTAAPDNPTIPPILPNQTALPDSATQYVPTVMLTAEPSETPIPLPATATGTAEPSATSTPLEIPASDLIIPEKLTSPYQPISPEALAFKNTVESQVKGYDANAYNVALNTVRDANGLNTIEVAMATIDDNPALFTDKVTDKTFVTSVLRVLNGAHVGRDAPFANPKTGSADNLFPAPKSDVSDFYSYNGGAQLLYSSARAYENIIYDGTQFGNFTKNVPKILESIDVDRGGFNVKGYNGVAWTDIYLGKNIDYQIQWSLDNELLVPVLSADKSWKPGQIDLVAAKKAQLKLDGSVQLIPEEEITSYTALRFMSPSSILEFIVTYPVYVEGNQPGTNYSADWYARTSLYQPFVGFGFAVKDYTRDGPSELFNGTEMGLAVSNYITHAQLWNPENGFLTKSDWKKYLSDKVQNNFFSFSEQTLTRYEGAVAGTDFKKMQQANLNSFLEQGDYGGQLNKLAVATLYFLTEKTAEGPFFSPSQLTSLVGIQGATSIPRATNVSRSDGRLPGVTASWAPLFDYAFKAEPGSIPENQGYITNNGYVNPLNLKWVGYSHDKYSELPVSYDVCKYKTEVGPITYGSFVLPDILKNDGPFLYEFIPMQSDFKGTIPACPP